jgi:outer membrane protein assembly factor BamB
MRYATIALAAAMWLLPPDVARGENWAQFRGPNGAGRAAGPFTEAMTPANIAWKTDLPGVGHSSPIVWSDHVYVTSANTDDARRWVICLSADTGKELWRHELKFITHRKHRDNSFASPTPCTDDQGIYVVFTTPQEYTLLSLGHDGKERWKTSLGRYDSNHGGGASPMVHGDLVYVNFDQESETSALRAFDRTTGKQIWATEHRTRGKAAMSTPVVFRPSGGGEQIVFTTWGGGIRALDPKTGKALWTAEDVFFSRPIGTPQVTADLVVGVCGEGNGTRSLVAVKPADGKATVVYKIDQLGPHVPSPLILGDRLVLLNDLGQLTVGDLATGRAHWSQKLPAAFYGSPVAVSNVIWAVSKTGTLFGLRLEADKAVELCTVDLGGKCHTTPAVADGRMFVRTESTVVCLKK